MPNDEEKSAPQMKQNWNYRMARGEEDQFKASLVAKWFNKDFEIAQGWIWGWAQMFTSFVNLDDCMIISYLWAWSIR